MYFNRSSNFFYINYFFSSISIVLSATFFIISFFKYLNRFVFNFLYHFLFQVSQPFCLQLSLSFPFSSISTVLSSTFFIISFSKYLNPFVFNFLYHFLFKHLYFSLQFIKLRLYSLLVS